MAAALGLRQVKMVAIDRRRYDDSRLSLHSSSIRQNRNYMNFHNSIQQTLDMRGVECSSVVLFYNSQNGIPTEV